MDTNTTARALIAAPVKAPTGTNASWAAAYDRWRLAHALLIGCNHFGHARDADNDHNVAVHHAKSEFGSIVQANRNPAVAQRIADAYDRGARARDAEYDAFIRPADLAAVDLVLIPAPTIEAVYIKIDVIRAHELDNHTGMPEHPFDVIERDVRRLGAGGEA